MSGAARWVRRDARSLGEAPVWRRHRPGRDGMSQCGLVGVYGLATLPDGQAPQGDCRDCLRCFPRAVLVLWGKHAAHGSLWLKLAEAPSQRDMERRQAEGWQVVRLAKGQHPDDHKG